MDVRELKYFLRVAKDGSFSVAATKLYVSQPALSKVIHKMEEELGFSLFYTFQKRQRLTDEGARFYDRAVRVVDEYDALIASANLERPIYQGQISFGFPPVAGSCFLCDLIVEFSKEHPGIKLVTEETGTQKILKDVEANVLDVGLVIGPVREDVFDGVPVKQDENLVVVSYKHPYAQYDSIKLRDMANESFIMHDTDFSMHNTFYEAAMKEGFSPNIVLRSAHWDFILQAVRLNYGISILPQSIFDTFYVPGIKILTLDDPLRFSQLYLITKKAGYTPGAVKLFCEFAKDLLASKESALKLEPITVI